MPRFELKKYHKNMGHEGEGFNCELWVAATADYKRGQCVDPGG